MHIQLPVQPPVLDVTIPTFDPKLGRKILRKGVLIVVGTPPITLRQSIRAQSDFELRKDGLTELLVTFPKQWALQFEQINRVRARAHVLNLIPGAQMAHPDFDRISTSDRPRPNSDDRAGWAK